MAPTPTSKLLRWSAACGLVGWLTCLYVLLRWHSGAGAHEPGGADYATPDHVAVSTVRIPGAPTRDTEVLTVHLIPHSHSDVGWKKTVDQYFFGTRHDIHVANVQATLDSVVKALQLADDRRFIWVEIAFFELWYERQTVSTQAAVQQLVASGQLEFVSGGYCMNDEASTLYTDTIDQFTRGHTYLARTFGNTSRSVPLTGWQIDPFGHSIEQGWLSAAIGFEMLVLGRIDYADRIARRQSQRMEGMWNVGSYATTKQIEPQQSAPALSANDLHTHILYKSYSAPDGFWFDIVYGSAEPIQDDPSYAEYNVEERAADFARWCREQASAYPNPTHILVPMGDDFNYADADAWYGNMDKLIRYFQRNPQLNIMLMYSTPLTYHRAVIASSNTSSSLAHTEPHPLPAIEHDFFPYSDGSRHVWVGYYTSRPTFKYYVRAMSAFLAVCRQVDVLGLVGLGGSWHRAASARMNMTASLLPVDGPSASLWDAVSIAQHHDAITGTQFQPVADDYSYRLSVGQHQCIDSINSVLARHVVRSDNSQTMDHIEFVQCPLLNQSVCPASMSWSSSAAAAAASGQHSTISPLTLLAYNALIHPRHAHISIPIDPKLLEGDIDVYDDQHHMLSYQITQLPTVAQLHLSLLMPPVGYAMCQLSVRPRKVQLQNGAAGATAAKAAVNAAASPYSRPLNLVTADEDRIENAALALMFSTSTGEVVAVVDKVTSERYELQISHGWREARGHDGNLPASDPYAMCLKDNTLNTLHLNSWAVQRGSVVDQLIHSHGPWHQTIYQLWHHSNHSSLQVLHSIGPIDVEDGVGKEVSTVYSLHGRQLNSVQGSNFSTDGNGRRSIQRQRNFRPSYAYNNDEPVAGNIYPINTHCSLLRQETEPDTTSPYMSVIVDRATGCTSLNDGELEVMTHRRLIYDNQFPPLNEVDEHGTGIVVNITHWLHFHRTVEVIPPADVRTLDLRLLAHELQQPSQLLFSGASSPSISMRTWSAVDTSDLDPRIHLLTMQAVRLTEQSMVGEADAEQWGMLLRLEHMVEAQDESTSVDVDIGQLLRPLCEVDTIQSTSMTMSRTTAVPSHHLVISIAPMQISTNIVRCIGQPPASID